MAEKWIQRAIKRPGRLKAAAQRAGMSVAEYAAKKRHEGSSLGAAARLYFTLRKLAKRRKQRKTLADHMKSK